MVFCRWLRGTWGIDEKNNPHYVACGYRGGCWHTVWLVVTLRSKKAAIRQPFSTYGKLSF
jgi:hypothetical protein